jgi:hypothetical protein
MRRLGEMREKIYLPDFSPTGIEDEGDRGVEEDEGEKTSPTSPPSLPSPPLICRLVRNSGSQSFPPSPPSPSSIFAKRPTTYDHTRWGAIALAKLYLSPSRKCLLKATPPISSTGVKAHVYLGCI